MHPRPRGDDRGVALPSWSIGVSIGIVVLAMLALVLTGRPDRGEEAAADPVSESSAPTEPASTAPASTEPPRSTPSGQPSTPQKPPEKEPERPDRARDAYVEVYNNSGIAGLANETAATLQDTGWKVVGADNWYGDIPDSTVYYPERLHDVAKLLAADLGIARLHTAVAPMRFDRLTLILTGPL